MMIFLQILIALFLLSCIGIWIRFAWIAPMRERMIRFELENEMNRGLVRAMRCVGKITKQAD